MKYRVIKWYVERLDKYLYGIQWKTQYGNYWKNATSETFANENDAIKHIKESLR